MKRLIDMTDEELRGILQKEISDALEQYKREGRPSEMLTAKEACQILRCGRTTLWRLGLKNYGIGKRLLYRRADVEGLLNQRAA